MVEFILFCLKSKRSLERFINYYPQAKIIERATEVGSYFFYICDPIWEKGD